MSSETGAEQASIIIRLDEPARDIPEGAAVDIIVLESAASTFTIGERVAYLSYIYTLISTKFSADVRAGGASTAISQHYSKVLEWLLCSINSIEDAYQFRTLLVLNEHLQPFRTNLLKHILTGCSITAQEIQEQLSALAEVFAEWVPAAASPGECKPMQEHDIYFLGLDEIRRDRLHYLDNQQALCRALDRATSLELTGIEVGFYKEAPAAAVVRGKRDKRKRCGTRCGTRAPATALAEAASV